MKARAGWSFAAAAVTLAAGIGIASHFHRLRGGLREAITTEHAAVSGLAAALRPKYPYSVVPGGVYSLAELERAIRTDPVVRAHYSGFDAGKARLVTLKEDRYEYVSYRVKDEVFWTRRRLKIPKGELLLTDGSKFARTRCGNQVSERALAKTFMREPSARMSLPAMTLKNLHNFEFAQSPELALNRELELQLPPEIHSGLPEDRAPQPWYSSGTAAPVIPPWLGMPLGVLPILHGHTGSNSANPLPIPPAVVAPTPPAPNRPEIPTAPVPEPGAVCVDMLAALGLIAAKVYQVRLGRR